MENRAAAELFWTMTSLRTWQDLVHRRWWSTSQWIRRTTAALEAALVAGESGDVVVTKVKIPAAT